MDTRAVFDHHLQAFGAGDLEGILADYSEESVFMTPDGVLTGLDALRAAFTELLAGPFTPGTYDLDIDALNVEGEALHVVWHASCQGLEIPFAADTLVIRDGKILLQTFAAQMQPA